MNNQKNNTILELDLIEYAKYEGKMPIIISNGIQKVLSYNSTFNSFKSEIPFNLVCDESSLGKAIVGDKRVSNVVDLFPSIINLYNVQKDLMKPVYFPVKKASNDNKIINSEKSGEKIVKLPIKPQNPKPVEVKPNEKVVVPLRPKKSEIKNSNFIGYIIQRPIQYSVKVPISYSSKSYGNLERKIDLSINGMYYKR